jgi:hypothetical protein
VFAAIHAASARRCRRTRSLCGSSEVRACSCVPTNTLESRRESLQICAAESSAIAPIPIRRGSGDETAPL